MIVVLAAILSCPVPKVFNWSDMPWNKQDQAILERNIRMKRCAKYSGQFPCIVRAYKLGNKNYHFRCGKRRMK